MLRNNHLHTLCKGHLMTLPFPPRRDGFSRFSCEVKYPSPTMRGGSPMGAEDEVEESPEIGKGKNFFL